MLITDGTFSLVATGVDVDNGEAIRFYFTSKLKSDTVKARPSGPLRLQYNNRCYIR